MSDTARAALQSIAEGAGRARLGDRLPEDRRPSRALLEALGLLDPEVQAEAEAMEEVEGIEDDETDEE